MDFIILKAYLRHQFLLGNCDDIFVHTCRWRKPQGPELWIWVPRLNSGSENMEVAAAEGYFYGFEGEREWSGHTLRFGVVQHTSYTVNCGRSAHLLGQSVIHLTRMHRILHSGIMPSEWPTSGLPLVN